MIPADVYNTITGPTASEVCHLTLPTAEAWGFSGYACGNPLRSRLKAVSPPTARDAVRLQRGGNYSTLHVRLLPQQGENGRRSPLD